MKGAEAGELKTKTIMRNKKKMKKKKVSET